MAQNFGPDFVTVEPLYPNTRASHSKCSEIARCSENRVLIKDEKITLILVFLKYLDLNEKTRQNGVISLSNSVSK